MNPRKAKRAAIKAIEALYASLPKLECRGQCQETCRITVDILADLELARITERLGRDPGFPDNANEKVGDDLRTDCEECPLLTYQGKCSHYDIRPLLCRLWGMVDDPLMICPYGCRPTPRYLTNDEVAVIWRKLTAIGDRYEAAIDRDNQTEFHEGDEP